MAKYLAMRIKDEQLDYKEVVELYSQFKEDIDTILVRDNFENLIE